MQINISARHLKLTNSVADYIQKKVGKCQRYFDHIISAQVIIDVEKQRQMCEIVLHAKKATFRAKEESTDMYAAIDLTVAKMDKQLKKHKEIIKNTHKAKAMFVSMEDIDGVDLHQEDFGRNIDEVKQYEIKTMSIEDAVKEMKKLRDKFYMFNNEETSEINVVYVKDLNSYGLLKPKS